MQGLGRPWDRPHVLSAMPVHGQLYQLHQRVLNVMQGHIPQLSVLLYKTFAKHAMRAHMPL